MEQHKVNKRVTRAHTDPSTYLKTVTDYSTTASIRIFEHGHETSSLMDL